MTRHPIAQRFADTTHTDLFGKNGAIVPVGGEAGEKWEALCEDISIRGLQEPIIVLKGTDQILDGWHRHNACLHTGATPRYEEREFADEKAITEFVLGCHLRKFTEPHGIWGFLVEEKLYSPLEHLGSGSQKGKTKTLSFSTEEVARMCGRSVVVVQAWNQKWAKDRGFFHGLTTHEKWNKKAKEKHAALKLVKEQDEKIKKLEGERDALLDLVRPDDLPSVDESKERERKVLEEKRVERSAAARSALVASPPDAELWEDVVEVMDDESAVRVAELLGVLP